MEYEKPDRDLNFSMHYDSKKEGSFHKVIYHMTDKDGEALGKDLKDIEPRELYAITKILMTLTTNFSKTLEETEAKYWNDFDKEIDIIGRQIKSDIKTTPEEIKLLELKKKYVKLFI